MAETARPDGHAPPLTVLIGMKHCGKSTVGRKLARRLGAQFFDSDDLLERAHASDSGRGETCREIHRRRGRDYFQQVEADAIKAFLESLPARGPSVLALGGGTVLNRHLSDWLGPEATDRTGTFIYLRVGVDELWHRVQRGGIPSFVDPDDPAGSFRRIFAQRRDTYERLADIVIDAEGLGVGQVAAAAEKALTGHPRGGQAGASQRRDLPGDEKTSPHRL